MVPRTRNQLKQAEAPDGPSGDAPSSPAAPAVGKAVARTQSARKRQPETTPLADSSASPQKRRKATPRTATPKRKSTPRAKAAQQAEGEAAEQPEQFEQPEQPKQLDQPEPELPESRPELEPQLAAAVAEARGAESDADEAPEEVSLGAARQEVEAQQRTANRVRAEAQKAVRDRARRRAQRTAEEQQQSKRRRKAQQAAAEAEAEGAEAPAAPSGEDAAEAAGTASDADELPAEVIAALQEKARTDAQQAQQVAEQVAVEGSKAKRRRTQLTERQDGPLTVRLLDEKPAFAPSSAALAFARERLHGGGLKRSADMLRPVRTGGQPVFCPATTFGRQ